MKSNKHTNSKINLTTNLLGNTNHRNFLQIQASYGLAQRGGVQYPYINSTHASRLVSDINLLTSKETKQLIFSEIIFSN